MEKDNAEMALSPGSSVKMSSSYIPPKVTSVDFLVEVGWEGTVTKLDDYGGANQNNWAADEDLGDGTEGYTFNNNRGDFF